MPAGSGGTERETRPGGAVRTGLVSRPPQRCEPGGGQDPTKLAGFRSGVPVERRGKAGLCSPRALQPRSTPSPGCWS